MSQLMLWLKYLIDLWNVGQAHTSKNHILDGSKNCEMWLLNEQDNIARQTKNQKIKKVIMVNMDVIYTTQQTKKLLNTLLPLFIYIYIYLNKYIQ